MYEVGTPIPTRIIVRPDRSFTFDLRTPPTATLLFAAAGVPKTKNKVRGAGNVPGPKSLKDGAAGKAHVRDAPGNSMVSNVGEISLKHIYEIAKIKQTELRLSGLSLEGLCRSVAGQAASIGIKVVA